jgi:hypothetical protein
MHYYSFISNSLLKNLAKDFRRELKELDKAVVKEDSVLLALDEFLKYQKNSDLILYKLEELLKSLEEDETFKLGVLLILASVHPYKTDILQSLKGY